MTTEQTFNLTCRLATVRMVSKPSHPTGIHSCFSKHRNHRVPCVIKAGSRRRPVRLQLVWIVFALLLHPNLFQWASAAPIAGKKAWAWGYADNGDGLTNVPPGLSNVVAVAAGAVHNVVLRSDGTVFSWGASYFGFTNAPPGLSNVVAISAG